LTNAKWEEFHTAIMAGDSLTLPTGEGREFHLNVMRDAYYNPVDGVTYKSSGEWRTYRPTEPSSDTNEPSYPHIEMTRIVFLTNPSHEECNVDALAAYIKRVGATLASSLPEENPSTSGASIIVQFDIQDNKVTDVKIQSDPTSDVLHVDELRASILGIPAPEKATNTRFQLFFDVWGGLVKEPASS
jgi:hypothetical protein